MSGDEILAKYNYCASKHSRYKYTRVLGSGSFGTVLKARDTETAEVVAVKIIAYKGFIIKDSSQPRKEVDILTQLKHDNIVRIKDSFEYREWILISGIAIVMELCPLGSLSEVLKGTMSRKQTISEEKRFVWYIQLMSALVHIHGKCIAHRDIKPENILVDARGILKIGDVGLSRVLYTEENLLECSSSLYMQTLVGTIPFMAPEVFSNHYTMKSDIFSMGLVMFVICELPQNLIPIIKGKLKIVLQSNNIFPGLGLFYHQGVEAKATEVLLTTKSLIKEEGDIFDNMLTPNYRDRLDSSQVLCKLNEVVRRRKEEKMRKDRVQQNVQQILQENSNQKRRCAMIVLFFVVLLSMFAYKLIF